MANDGGMKTTKGGREIADLPAPVPRRGIRGDPVAEALADSTTRKVDMMFEAQLSALNKGETATIVQHRERPAWLIAMFKRVVNGDAKRELANALEQHLLLVEPGLAIQIKKCLGNGTINEKLDEPDTDRNADAGWEEKTQPGLGQDNGNQSPQVKTAAVPPQGMGNGEGVRAEKPQKATFALPTGSSEGVKEVERRLKRADGFANGINDQNKETRFAAIESIGYDPGMLKQAILIANYDDVKAEASDKLADMINGLKQDWQALSFIKMFSTREAARNKAGGLLDLFVTVKEIKAVSSK